MQQELHLMPDEGIRLRFAPPGSQNAVNRGCTCPQLTNNFGYGRTGFKGSYVYNPNCPVHPLKARDF